jgi:hypothetical protein
MDATILGLIPGAVVVLWLLATAQGARGADDGRRIIGTVAAGRRDPSRRGTSGPSSAVRQPARRHASYAPPWDFFTLLGEQEPWLSNASGS